MSGPLLLVDRYTAREFAGPFLAAVAGFTVMLLSSLLFELTDLIFDRKMPLETVARMLLYRTPGIVSISLPIAVLFGALLSLGRLAKDSELKILLGTGTPFRRLAVPIFIIALAVSFVSFALNERIVPEANHRAEMLFRAALFRDPLPSIEEGVFFRGGDDRFFYIGSVDRRARTMKQVMIYQLGGGTYPEIITAARGTYEDHMWHLEEGIRKTLDDEGYTLEDAAFERLEYPMTEGLDVYLGNYKSTEEMTRKELGEHIRLFKQSGLDVKRFEVAYHMKLSLPLAGLLWTLVGAPLALHQAKGGRIFGIAASIGLAFLYYVLASVFRSLGGNGLVPPLAAAWLTNILFALTGIGMLWRADRV